MLSKDSGIPNNLHSQEKEKNLSRKDSKSGMNKLSKVSYKAGIYSMIHQHIEWLDKYSNRLDYSSK